MATEKRLGGRGPHGQPMSGELVARTPKAQAIAKKGRNASAVLTMMMRVMRPLSAP